MGGTEDLATLGQALGQRLRLVRESRGLSQAELARTLGVSHATISDIERGKQRLTVLDLYRLARALGAAPLDLLPDGGTGQVVDVAATVADLVRRVEALEAKR